MYSRELSSRLENTLFRHSYLQSGMLLTADDIQIQLSRRRPGQSALTTAVYPPLSRTHFSEMKKTEYKYNLAQSSIRLWEHPLVCSSRISTNDLMITLKWISILDLVMQTGPISRNMVLKQAVAAAAVRLEKPSVA